MSWDFMIVLNQIKSVQVSWVAEQLSAMFCPSLLSAAHKGKQSKLNRRMSTFYI